MEDAYYIYEAEEYKCKTLKSEGLMKIRPQNNYVAAERSHQVYVQVPNDLSSIFLVRAI